MSSDLPASTSARDAFDLVIVGAGIIGAWCAYLAAGSRGVRTLIIDRSLCGAGATARSAGLDLPYGVSPARFRLTSRSDAMYKDLLCRHPGLPIREYPLHFVADPQDWNLLRCRVTQPGLRRADAEEVQLLREGVPGLRLVDPMLVSAGTSCRAADVGAVARALVNLATSSGHVRLWEGRRVEQISSGDRACVLRFHDGGDAVADRVIWATGPWLAEPVAAEAAAAGVRVKRVVSLHIDAGVPASPRVPFVVRHDAFLVPLPMQQQWLLSYTRELWDEHPDTLVQSLTPDDLRFGLEVLDAIAPTWVEACRSGRAFCDAYGPTRDPVVAPWAHDGRVIFAGAGSGSGYRLAPAIARDALHAVLPEVFAGDPAPLHPAAEVANACVPSSASRRLDPRSDVDGGPVRRDGCSPPDQRIMGPDQHARSVT